MQEVTEDGALVAYHFLPITEGGIVTGVFSIVHDAGYNATDGISKSMQNLNRIIASTHDSVVRLDADKNVTYWNHAAEQLYGYNSSEMMGKSMDYLLPKGRDNIKRADELAAEQGTGGNYIKTRVTKAGKLVDVVINYFLLVDENEQLAGSCEIGKDITEALACRKRTDVLSGELAIRNRQLAVANSDVKAFTDVAARDYGERLRQLYLYLEYIVANEAAKLSNPGRANVRKAQAAIQKMKLLTEDITSFARLGELDASMQQLHLDQVLNEVVDGLKDKIAGTGASLQIDALPEVKGFPFLVSLIFHHLLQNAIKFRKDGERPTIAISSERSISGKWIKYEAARPDICYHVITICDNGIGFDKEQAETIFRIFSRLHPDKYPGSGIGLAICYKAMELHGGFIVAESKGDGASFSCFFPAL